MKGKKTIAAIAVAVIALSALVATGFAFGQNRPTVYSSFTGEVSAGDDIAIPVSIRDNPGIMGFMLEFSYDSDIITPTSVDYGNIISGGLQDNIAGDAEPGSFRVYWAGNENVSSNGVLFYINAHINETAVGTETIQVNYSQSDTFDEDFNDVELSCENIELSIANAGYSQYAKVTSSDASVTAGDNLQIPLTISEINDVTELSLSLTYDADNFTFISAESLGTVTSNDNNGAISIDVSGITAAMDNSEFVTLTFKAKDQADSGSYPFTLSSEDEGIICKSCTVTINPSATSEVAEISIPEGIIIEKNETADIPVMISNNHGIMGYRLSFNYNPEEIEVLSVKNSNDVNGDVYDSIGDNPASFDVLWNYTEEFSGEATLFFIEVKNISNSYKESAIGISYSQQDTFNENYDDVVLDCKNGTITLCPGHSYIQQTYEATCTEKGCTKYVCEYCSNTYQTDFTDEIGHYYQYTGNQRDYEMTYVCVDCGEELSINADEVYAMWNSDYMNTRPNRVDNRIKTDNSSLLNVIPDSNVNDGIINAKDYALLLKLQNANN